jgi:hypothetical protein
MRLLLISFISTCLINVSVAQEERYLALFIVKFCENISFKTDEISISIYGSDEVVSELQKIALIKTKFKIKKAERWEDAAGSDVLFVGDEKLNEFNKIKTVPMSETVIITQSDGYTDKGANISFLKDDGKIRFKIDKDKFQKQGLILSKGLISLAM